jgi:D-alanyl-D-alanine carboxypeptidase/D-alanyl-D-alanine-endopeptidase (penicillin-binding protein 4)
MRRLSAQGVVVGASVVSLRDGRSLFDSFSEKPLTPASTMKVLTGAAILDKLGPEWRFQTRFYADGPVTDGVVDGNLYVVGSCAPDLVVERFPEIGAAIAAARVREVRGDIVADLQYFDGEERPPEWPYGRQSPYSAPISALAANFSSVRVTVTPGPRPAAPAVVRVEPPSDAVQLTSTVRTVKGGRPYVHTSRRLERTSGGTVGNRIVVSGRMPIQAGPWEDFLTIEDPAGVAVSAVKRALQGADIVVRGTSRIGTLPPSAVPVYTLESKPLSEIVRDMNKHSNNFIAELLLRTLGAETFGRPGSREKGSRAVEAFLRTCGIDPDPVNLTDGSGLSRSNTLTPETLVRVLVRMWGDERIGGSFVDSLPIGGIDGTLRGRMFGAAQGRVLAKTGHIGGVSALAGYVEDTSEGPVAFAFIVNGSSRRRADRALDDLCSILCAAPPAGAL